MVFKFGKEFHHRRYTANVQGQRSRSQRKGKGKGKGKREFV